MNFSILITANTTCPKMCKFEMSNVNSNGKHGLKIQLLFNSYNETIVACSNPSQKFRNLKMNCSSWNEGKLYKLQELILTFTLIFYNYLFV